VRLRALAAAVLPAALAACAPQSPALPHASPVAALSAEHAPRWSPADVRALQAGLRRVFADSSRATNGIAVVDADARPLFGLHERSGFTPASTFKLLCGIASLEMLGAAYRFPTELRALEGPQNGSVASDLWLVGSGDPTLRGDDISAAAGTLARARIARIDGALVADPSAFEGPEVNPGWDPADLQYGFAAGTSALAIDEGTVEFHLVPTHAGEPARIEVRPRSDAVLVTGGVRTGSGTELSIDRDPVRNRFAFSGTVAVGAEQSFWRPVAALPLYAARVLRSRLEERGIDVRGGVRLGAAPLGGVTFWLHRSAPLASIVHDMWLTSDNHHAEQLLRSLGAQRGIGTAASGASVEHAMLARDGVPAAGLRVVDGSGLAPGDRVAPITLAMLLARAANGPSGPTIVRALPRVGVEGTVRYRTLEAAAGRVRAKSGHIAGVNALAGYVQTRHHGRVAFAFIVNGDGAGDGPVDAGIDRALDILANS
jgi:D-alanyl-D-alanine carboxypeptidase/D-alanyl-D-alanine-endopeptidase (penicillin-binding protein 4)